MKIQSTLIYLTFVFIVGCKNRNISSTNKFEFENHTSSEVINDETFDLKFTLRVLPDNGWFLELHKDASYEYIHWSGWGSAEGVILEKGKYVIKENQIMLQPKGVKRELQSKTFFLFTTDSVGVEMHISCVESDLKTYCLYSK